MNVLVISEQWWPEGTGGILASHLIANILRDSGFELTVVHGTRQPKIVRGINYIYTELLNVRNKYKLWINCMLLVRESWFLKVMHEYDAIYIPRYCYPLIPMAEKLGKKVIVHLHDYQPVSYNAVVFNEARERSFLNADDIRFELLEHNSALRAFGALSAPANALCRKWVSEVDVMICVSKRQSEIISNRAPELAYKIKVVYNPLPETPPLEEKFVNPTFTFAGGGSYIKGFQIFVQASLNVLKKGKNASFMFAGGLRGFKQHHMKLLERLNGSHMGNFRLLGRLPYEDVIRLYSRSHAVLVPSISEEPLPYVVMEAMAVGTLPLASRIGGIPEIVEGTYAEGMLFEPGSVEELVDRMESVLALSNEQIKEIGFKLRETVMKRFNPETIKASLIEAFSSE